MTLTTQDLRTALADAADRPYEPLDGSRLDDVRARVRARRRRRGAAVAATSGAAIVAATASFMLGGGSPTRRPLPAASPRPSALTEPALPALWGVRDVVGDLTGSGWQTPQARWRWPSGTTGLLVRCSGSGRAVHVDIRPAVGVASRATVPCSAAEPWHAPDLPTAASRIPAGTDVTVQAQLDAPEARTTFAVALLVGKNVVDGSLLATPPSGYTRLASFSLADGLFYRWTGDGIDPSTVDAGAAPESALLQADRGSEILLRVRCSGRSVVEVTGGDGQTLGSVECPADKRVTHELDLGAPPEGPVTVRVADADAGALVQVGAYVR